MKISFLILSLFLGASAEAKLVTKRIEYKDKDAVLDGYLAYDDAAKGRRPGVLVVHEWMGEGKYEEERAEMLAKLGYVAFAADIYGKGVRPTDPKDAGAMAGKFKGDLPLLRERATAGLDELRKQPNVDPAKLAAIGYCFGGTTVLELARSGAALRGVASFHGGLATSMPAEAGKLKAKIVAFHGAEDPFVKPEEVRAFEDEMRKANADWVFSTYAHAVHRFSNFHAVGKNAAPGAAYHAEADKRSWASLQDFFREWF